MPIGLVVELNGDSVHVLVHTLVLELEELHTYVDDCPSEISHIANHLDRNWDRLPPTSKRFSISIGISSNGSKYSGESSNNRGSTNPRWPIWRRVGCGAGDGDDMVAEENEEGRRRTY